MRSHRLARGPRAALVESLEGRTLLSSYYFSAAGNDATGNGSQAAPWATINKLNTLDLNPGDQVFFRGGDTFSGGINIDPTDAGTAANPVTINSYGTGRATISAGNGNAIHAYNCAGYDIKNLVLVGSPLTGSPLTTTNTGSGISFYNDAAGDVIYSRIRIDNVEAHGFRDGILIGSWLATGNTGSGGYNDVRITNSSVHGNHWTAVSTYAYTNKKVHTNVYVGNVRAFDNPGDWSATTFNTGNGIRLGGVNGGTIEYCVAYNNGWQNRPVSGPVGIWAYESNNVTIQYNESYGNRTAGGDGGGFDLDGAVTNSVMQYNYSHDNDGAGFLLAQYAGATAWGGNIIRYNISENDGRRGGLAAIELWYASSSSPIANAQIYNNTIYLTPANSATLFTWAVRFNAGGMNNVHFRNNNIVTTGGVRLINNAYTNHTNVRFEGNNYWSSGGSFRITWGSTTYNSLAAFRTATGQERVNSVDVGLSADPKLNSPGGGGTIGNPRLLGSLTAYKLRLDSPLRDAGLNLTQSPFNLNVGTRDYYGAALPQNQSFDIGAHEAIPGPWQNQDVGAVNFGGTAKHDLSNNTWTLTGSGADIWNTADQFQYAYQTLHGDGSIIARVDSVQNVDQWTKAGVMIRESLAVGSKHASMFVTPTTVKGVSFQYRNATNGTSAATSVTGLTAPYWVKLTRAGANITAYRSADGQTWTQVGSPVAISMTTDVYAGLALTSHNANAVASATFSNVQITGGTNLLTNGGFESGLPPWTTSGSASRVTSGARTGTAAGALTGSGQLLYNVTGLTANTTYTFRGFLKAAAGETLSLGVSNYGGPDRSMAITSASWTQGFITFTTGATNTSAQLYIRKTAGAGLSLADDLELLIT